MAIGKIFGVFNISASGLSAQRKNLEVRAQNIANEESIDSRTGQPYKAKEVYFTSVEAAGRTNRAAGHKALELTRSSPAHRAGFQSAEMIDEASSTVEATVTEAADQRTKMIYAPEHPNANEEGYVEVADIDSIGEMVKLISAGRAYEANATVLQAAKDMFKKALEI
jgi:flagellar basal-body rod protein FlgC